MLLPSDCRRLKSYPARLLLGAVLACSGAPTQAETALRINTGGGAPYTRPDGGGFLDRVVGEVFRRIGRAAVVVQPSSARDIHATQLSPPLASSEMFIYLHRKHAALAQPAARALRAMKSDGTYARLFEDTLLRGAR